MWAGRQPALRQELTAPRVVALTAALAGIHQHAGPTWHLVAAQHQVNLRDRKVVYSPGLPSYSIQQSHKSLVNKVSVIKNEAGKYHHYHSKV